MSKRAAIFCVALAAATPARVRAADHLDGAQVKTSVDPSADITDLFAWMSADKTHVNLVLNVFPQAGAGAHFSPQVQYVFHVSSLPAYGMAASGTTNIICTFTTAQIIQCWIGDADYVTGDAVATTGVTSASGKVKVFAGPRDDPFFFNLAGFKAAVNFVHANVGAGAHLETTLDASGCPHLSGPQAATLRGYLAGDGTNPSGVAKDFFAGLNVLSIALSIDVTLLVKGTNPILSVWASTHKAP
jgi:hypothetical protein